MAIIMILFFVVFPVLLIYLAIKYSKLKKSYAEVKEKADKIAEADAYNHQKHYEADTYYAEKHRDGLDYYEKKVKNADERYTKLESKIADLNKEQDRLKTF